MTKPSFAVVGCGRLGTALAKHLTAAGYPLVGLASRSLASAKETATLIDAACYGDPIWEMTKTADVVFLTTPDGIISQAFKTVLENSGFKPGAVVLHCSGAHPSTILKPSDTQNIHIGSMHPMQSFASKSVSGNPFDGIIISVEGSEKAVSIATAMATDLGAVCLPLATKGKTLYHASAVVASNYLVALMQMALNFMETAGISSDQAFGVLSPLVNGTLSNIEKNGVTDALTGPIARGDVETVQRHLTAILTQSPEFIDLYKILGRYTVNIAEKKQTVPRDQITKLRKILS